MAPFFVLLEVILMDFNLYSSCLDGFTSLTTMVYVFLLLQALQSFFGYEPYPGFHAIVQAKVDAEITEWKETKQRLVS